MFIYKVCFQAGHLFPTIGKLFVAMVIGVGTT